MAGLGLHEAGHAAGGWLAGIETRVLSIGFGPVLWKLRFRETDLV